MPPACGLRVAAEGTPVGTWLTGARSAGAGRGAGGAGSDAAIFRLAGGGCAGGPTLSGLLGTTPCNDACAVLFGGGTEEGRAGAESREYVVLMVCSRSSSVYEFVLGSKMATHSNP
eukprot:CAMPEP_0119113340 /NCGR_PEP_ID=MMETSP1180-20130426/43593_1 /TAXON_ID=3052 ORGANISM="Chlamydomonas cf sp, Strain CCMP681" /NCGR_SAMPLE_ID=MMETSP1180 /ASSEMBLY_ACC=CAM_ASM_000741 /LENGTH=115 /DNA_ID=CAMNT_0007101335 /DNA_START=293 /DNA_END=637 /DNA_ORIENTATION=+